MKTYFEELEERKNKCKTIADWKALAEELSEEAYLANNEVLATHAIILEKYGRDVLNEIEAETEILLENAIPLNIAAFLFGYQKEEMCPVSQAIALEAFEDGREVWLLNPDNTEELATSTDVIETHEGMFGVTFAELERIAKESEQNSERV